VELSDQQVTCLAKAAAIVKAGFNADEARDWHGRWTTEGNTANTQVVATRRQDRKSQCIDECYRILERWEPPGSDRKTWDFHNCVNECRNYSFYCRGIVMLLNTKNMQKAIASISAEISIELLNPVFQKYPDIKQEAEQKIAKYGKFI
jgi:hypothetical protein